MGETFNIKPYLPKLLNIDVMFNISNNLNHYFLGEKLGFEIMGAIFRSIKSNRTLRASPLQIPH
jgi:hypothetical protein